MKEWARKARGWRVARTGGKWCLTHEDGSIVWISADEADRYLERGMSMEAAPFPLRDGPNVP